jgi:hypothetical protein
MATPLDVLGDLDLTVDGEHVAVRGDGRRVVVDVPSLATARRLITKTPYGDTPRATAAYVNDLLAEVDLTLDVMLNHKRVVRLGADARPNAVSRLLNLGDVEVHPSVPARESAARNPVATALLLITGVGLLLWLLRRGDD